MKRVIGLVNARWIFIAAGCLCLAVLSGCDLITDPKLLMKPPELLSSQQSLRSAVDAYTPQEMRLQTRDGNSISSIQTADLNNDGNLEAVVFFESLKGDRNAQGMILEEEGNAWVVKQKFEAAGKNLLSLEYKDLNHDGKKEIIATFGVVDPTDPNTLAVYAYNGGQVEKILQAPYTIYLLDDLNNDDLVELTTVAFKQNNYNTVTCYQIKANNQVEPLGHLELGNSINGYLNAIAGKVTKNKHGIILDASYLTHSAYSTLIVLNDNKLVNVIDQDDNLNDMPIRSSDVNDDDILEMGRLRVPSGWEKVILDKPPRFLDYYQWDETAPSEDLKNMKLIKEQYLDPEGRFVFNFPDDLKNKITLDPNSVIDQYLRFVKLSDNEQVAEIKFIPASQWESSKNEWSMLKRDNDQIIAYKTNYGSDMIKKNIR
ncbi:hypothetical protein [Paenibacillus sp. J22TS3]|uniref:hypothetical protein n=1 Tax=Paenibacillus sp. J22TS3 TaxID=2807192 RepID=UPI001BCCE7C9|nr:hypothetical protein [Paenibacillus sp. J22TS3]